MPELCHLTVLEVLAGFKTKAFLAQEVVASCLRQIEKHDTKLKTLLTIIKEQALESARQADEKLQAASDLEALFDQQPLLGVPYICKDNFCTKGIVTTAASNVLKTYIPPYESTVTSRLKVAGAVLLGKANMDAFAHGSSTENSDFFTTLNPWATTKIPGGSSGGSAAAVSADMCCFAIGSETAGSIRGPASWCGVVGLKPTYGRVSRYGVIAMASSTDSPGPLTKTVADAAYILKVIAGKDELDATSSAEPVADYPKILTRQSLAGLKIGKPRSYFELELEPGVRQQVEKALAVLKDLGAELVDIDLLAPKYSIAVYTLLQRSEVSSNLARFDGIRYGNNRQAFGFEAKKRMILGAYALSSGYYDEYYETALRARTLIVDDFKTAFSDVDLIVGPTMPSVALDLHASEKSALFGELVDLLQEPSSIAGLCGLSLPCGISEGMPVGVQLIGPMFKEALLLSTAQLLEKSVMFKARPNLEVN